MSMSANLHGIIRAEAWDMGSCATLRLINGDDCHVTIFMPYATAQAMVDAFNGRIAALENALDLIAHRHIPDQPATDAGNELSWAQRQYAELRKIATAAMKPATVEATA